MTMVPRAVPKAMVETGTLASTAAAAPSASGRPTVVLPSVITTMVAGTGSPSASTMGAVLIGVEAGEDGLADGGGRAELEGLDGGPDRAAVGGGGDPDPGDAVEGDQADVDLLGQAVDEVERGGLWPPRSGWGSTSVACIDSEVSMARTTVARSLGTSTSSAGRAHGDHGRCQRDEEDGGGDVAAPAGAPGARPCRAAGGW